MARFTTRLQSGVRPRDLGGLVDLAIEVDNHQRKWRASGEQVARPASPQSGGTACRCVSPPRVQSCSPPSGPHPLGELPMQLGRTQLPATKRYKGLTSGSVARRVMSLPDVPHGPKIKLVSACRSAGERNLVLPLVLVGDSPGHPSVGA